MNKETAILRCRKMLKTVVPKLHVTATSSRSKHVKDSARHAMLSIANDQKPSENANNWKPGDDVDTDVEECLICCESKLPSQILALRACSHRVCHDCVARHVKAQVEDNRVPIACPHGCGEDLDLDQCRPHLSPKIVEKFETALVVASILESEIVYCPFPNCSVLMVEAEDRAEDRKRDRKTGGFSRLWTWIRSRKCTPTPRRKCLECHRLFCKKCRVPWHAGILCEDFRMWAENPDAAFLTFARRKQWQRCSNCQRMIEKTFGCSAVKCRCRITICYHCGRPWKSQNHSQCKNWKHVTY